MRCTALSKLALLATGLVLGIDGFAGPVLNFLLPDPALQVITVTDVTEAGAKLRPASPKEPVYYELSSVGSRDFGGVTANDKVPNEKDVISAATKVLSDRGFLPATKDHSPSLLLVLTWGTLRVLTDPSVGDGKLQTNREQMMRFLGGYKVGLISNNNSDTLEFVQGADLRFRGADIENLASIASHDLYVIAIGAYDFQAAAEKKKELLWTTKISAPARGFYMKEVFVSMLEISGPNLGRDTARPVLFNAADQLKGDVKFGETHVVGYLGADKPSSDASAQKKAP